MQIQGKVLAQQSHGLRLLSAKLNPGTDVKIGKMIQKLTVTELRHELEGLAIDVMGEIGTLYEQSPHIKNDGTWQFIYMYFLGLIIGGVTSQIQKNIIAERGLGMPKSLKFKEHKMYFGLSEEQSFFQDNVTKYLEDHASLDQIRKIASGDEAHTSKEIHRGFLNLWINGLLIPEEFGGFGLDLLFATVVSEGLGSCI